MSSIDDHTLITREYPNDTPVFSAGDRAEEAFLIEEGSVKIMKEDKEIAVLKKGDIFGEMAVIQNISHSSTAIAIEDKTLLVVITKNQLNEKMDNTDPLIKAMIHMFIKRLYASNQK